MNKLLTVQNLSKSYGKKEVFKNISFHIEEGKIIGLLGENGIGKTTLLRILSGITYADGGQVHYDQEPSFAILQDPHHFLPWMKVKDAIAFYRDFYPDFRPDMAEELCQQSNISPNDKITSLSKGNQERLCLFLTLSRKVRLYYLDEPLGGIDPRFKKELKKTILTNLDDNATVLIATHLLLDLETLMDEVMIIRRDRIVSQNTEELRENREQSIEDYYMEVTEHDSDY